MATSRYGFPQIAADQAQKHIPVNWSLDLIDAALASVVLSASLAVAPAAPALGDAYIVPAGATFGDVPAGRVAVWSAGAWHGFNPPEGARVLVLDEGRERIRSAGGWIVGQVRGAVTGAGLGLEVVDAIANLSGASVSLAGLIPARAIVLGVTSWTIAAVTGAPSYGVGIAGETTKFGGALRASVGSSNIGVVGPYATYAAHNLLITPTSGTFTGGRVGVAVSLIRLGGAPI